MSLVSKTHTLILGHAQLLSPVMAANLTTFVEAYYSDIGIYDSLYILDLCSKVLISLQGHEARCDG